MTAKEAEDKLRFALCEVDGIDDLAWKKIWYFVRNLEEVLRAELAALVLEVAG